MVNIKTRAETVLDGNDSFTLDANNTMGYSIRCDIISGGRLSAIRFNYDGKNYTESVAPYYMLGGKAAAKTIVAVEYLSSCGPKVVKVEGFLKKSLSFMQTYKINVKYPSGDSCACAAEVIDFTLVDAAKTRDIYTLNEGNFPFHTFSFSRAPTYSNIRVNIRDCNPKVVESVYIEYDDLTICENFAPYAALGDSSKKDVANNMTRYNGDSISTGLHVVKATPYSQNNCKGNAGPTKTLTFRKNRYICCF